MVVRKADQRLIPPGINDERTRALWDAFAHAASEFDFSKLLMRNADEIPDNMLELALHDFSLSEFVAPDGLPIDAARRLIDQAWELHEKQGTDGGMQLGQALLGTSVSINHWWQQNPEPFHDTQIVTVWFETLLVDDTVIADAQHQAMARQLIDATKRWSQDIAVVFGVRALASQFIGAFSLDAGRYTAALPDDDPVAYSVPVYAAALALNAGTYTAAIGDQ